MAITQQRLKELFDYKEGNLIWKIKPSQPVEIGDIAGCFDNGYLRTRICGKPYLNHRLVYLYFHGYFPENFVDHIDRNTLNNKIDNLREVSNSCSSRNTKNVYTNNTSGVKGVSWKSGEQKWLVQIGIENKRKHLGLFDNFLEAVYCRLAAEQCLGWNICDKSSSAFNYIQSIKKHGDIHI